MVSSVADETTEQNDQQTPPIPQGEHPSTEEVVEREQTPPAEVGAEAEEPDAEVEEGAQAEESGAEAEEQAEEPESTSAEEQAPAETEEPAPDNKKWYVVKVQSGREESIKDAIERRVKIEGMDEYFGRIIIPVERVSEMQRNKRVVREKKLYPGYLMVNVEYNDRILYLFRETSGVGDFVGASLQHPPQPMSDKEVDFLLHQQQEFDETTKEKVIPSKFEIGDRVKVKDGTFAGMEGEIKEKLEAKGAIKVELTIFGRPVPVELEYWQVEYA